MGFSGLCLLTVPGGERQDDCRKDVAEDGEEEEVVGEGWVQGM